MKLHHRHKQIKLRFHPRYIFLFCYLDPSIWWTFVGNFRTHILIKFSGWQVQLKKKNVIAIWAYKYFWELTPSCSSKVTKTVEVWQHCFPFCIGFCKNFHQNSRCFRGFCWKNSHSNISCFVAQFPQEIMLPQKFTIGNKIIIF